MRKALAHVTPPPSMTDIVRLVHELHPPTPSSALSKMSPSPPPPKSAKTPPPPAASPAGRSKHIGASMIAINFTTVHLTFEAGSATQSSTGVRVAGLKMQIEEDEPPP